MFPWPGVGSQQAPNRIMPALVQRFRLQRPMEGLNIPTEISKGILAVHGDLAQQWLEELPNLAAALCDRWEVQLGSERWGAISLVIPGIRHGVPVALKLVPKNWLSRREIHALRFWNGRGAVQVLEHDDEASALLLERLIPGKELAELFEEDRDGESTVIACDVIRSIPKELPTEIGDWNTAEGRCSELQGLRRRFNGSTGPFPIPIFERAERIFKELVESQRSKILVHADLHQYNILSAQRSPWLAIDPHGLIAEPEYEVGAILRNPDGLASHPDCAAISKRRVDQMCDLLGYHRERIIGWGMCQAVLAAWWSLEDYGKDFENDLRIAEIFSEM